MENFSLRSWDAIFPKKALMRNKQLLPQVKTHMYKSFAMQISLLEQLPLNSRFVVFRCAHTILRAIGPKMDGHLLVDQSKISLFFFWTNFKNVLENVFFY